jgi:hypothetical protein
MTIFPSPSERGSLQDLRKRGGQPGNQNALKHGLYAHKYRHQEKVALTSAVGQDLLDEIDFMQVALRRFFDLADESESYLASYVKTAHTLAMTITRLADLTLAQMVLGIEDKKIALALSQAIAEVSRELRNKPEASFSPPSPG